MRSKKIGILTVLICVVGILVCLQLVQQVLVEREAFTQSNGQSENQENVSSIRAITPGSEFETSRIIDSPYSNINPAIITAAQANQEDWSSNYEIADTWTIQIRNASDLETVVENLGGEFVEAVAGFSDIYVVQFKDSKDPTIATLVKARIENHPEIAWFEQEIIETFALRYDDTPPPITDPLLQDQWHLKNQGDRWNVAGEDANVYPAWNYGVSGAGVHIAVVDTGTEGNHPDLAPNYRADLSFDYLDNDSSAYPLTSDETHGTAVSGVAAAAANLSCGVGAAFNAELIGVRLINENQGVSSSRQASAVSHRSDLVDIYNNSWGPDTDNGARMAGPGALSLSAIKNAVQDGRNGLGAIYIWAAGNGRAIGSNVNFDGWASNRYSIAVGAVGDQGKLSGYSEPGAPMLICAPSSGNTSGIRTTDLESQDGVAPGDCRIEFGGTSSASPLVAAIVALMLEANPNLNWRDVQHILAKTAVKVARTHSDWTRNGAGYWVNHNFGFGRVDAAAAVKAAQNWQSVGEVTTIDTNNITIEQTVPDSSTTGIQTTHTIDSNIRIEHVAVRLDMDAAPSDTTDWGDLKITLTSPSGTDSILAQAHTDAQRTYSQWTYWTVRCLDEPSEGNWTLKVEDLRTGNVHVAKYWRLQIFGTEITEEDNHPPIAVDDEFTISESTTYLDVLFNDTDEDDDPLEVISVYRSPKSEIFLHSSGLIEYTPGSGLGGVDTFGYTVQDGQGGVKTAEVSLIIPRPEANNDQVGTLENTPIIIDVLANDIDYDSDPLRITEFAQPAHGSVEIQDSTDLIYSPEEGFKGVDRFDYTITDDDDGTSEAEVTVFVTATDDYALRFDGDDDQVVIQNSQSQLQNTPFTVEAWIRPEGWGEGETGYGRIFDNGEIVFYIHGTGFPSYNPHSLLISLDHSNGTRSIHNTATNSLQLGKWQHVAVTYNNNNEVHLLINGVDNPLNAPFGAASGPLASGSQQIFIGEAASTQRAFQGAIDEFRVWNRALTTNEIFNRKDQTLAGNENGLLVYFPMNEGIGTTTRDAQTPTQNGTINEAKWIKGIIGDNAAPVPTLEELQSVEGQRLIIPVTGNDFDPDGDELTVSRIINVSTGSASFIDGSIIYQPPEGFTGSVRIDYEINDGYNGLTTASLILVIGEGLNYIAWEAINFAGNLGAREEDNDFDSLSNFTEYAFGTDPLSGSIDPTLWRLSFDGDTGVTIFTYTILRGSLDVSYKLLHTSDLLIWTIPVEGLDYETLSVVETGPDSETRTLGFSPENKKPIFLKLEALSLAGSQ